MDQKLLFLGGLKEDCDLLLLEMLDKKGINIFPFAFSFDNNVDVHKFFGKQEIWIRSDEELIHNMLDNIKDEISSIIVLYDEKFNISFELLRNIGVPLLVYSEDQNCLFSLEKGKLIAPILVIDNPSFKGVDVICEIYKRFMELYKLGKLPFELIFIDDFLKICGSIKGIHCSKPFKIGFCYN